MKCNDWVVEIDSKKYAVDRTFSNEPAIFVKNVNGYPETQHIYDHNPDENQLIVIFARVVKDE